MTQAIPAPPHRAEAIEAFNEGVRQMQAGNEADAVRSWERACELDQHMAPAYHNLIVYYGGQDMWDRVVDCYSALLLLDPFDTRTLVRQALAMQRAGRPADAVRNYHRAIRIYPYFRFWYEELAVLLEQLGEGDEAKHWQQRGAALDSDEAEMAWEDGVRHLRGENLPLAIACFEAVVDEYPENVDARLRLATALDRSGDVDAALSQLAETFDVAPEPALVHFHRARLLARRGRLDAARGDLEEALRIEPTYGRARGLLNQVLWQLTHDDNATTHGTSRAQTDTTDNQAPAAAANLTQTESPRPAFEVPALAGPDPSQRWDEQVRQIVRQAAQVPGPDGHPPRMGLLLEMNRELVGVASRTLELLSGPELSRLPGGVQPVYVIEGEPYEGAGTEGISASGWLGSDGYRAVDFRRWATPRDGLPIDAMLARLGEVGGSEGFNLVLIIAGGRVRADQTMTLGIVRRLPCFQIALVAAGERAGDLSMRMQGVAPNWAEVVAS